MFSGHAPRFPRAARARAPAFPALRLLRRDRPNPPRFLTSSRHRVKAARMPWMATTKPARCHATAGKCAVAPDRLFGVGRTAGIKPATRRQPGADRVAVQTNHAEQHGFHFGSLASNCAISVRSSVRSGSRKLLVTRRTRSRCGKFSRSRRKTSRATRRIRLRHTARRTCLRATTNPRRAVPSELGL